MAPWLSSMHLLRQGLGLRVEGLGLGVWGFGFEV